MKKKILFAILFVCSFALILTACSGDRAVSKLEVVEGLKTEYALGEVPDYSGVKVLVTYNDGSTETVGADKLTISTLNTGIVGKTKITITYEGVVLDWNVEIKGQSIDNPDGPGNNTKPTPTLTGIEYLDGVASKIYVGDTINLIALRIVANYSDGTEAIVLYTDGAISTNAADIDTSTAGDKTVTVSFGGQTTTFTVTVASPEIVKIEVDSESVDTVVEAGGELDLSAIKLYAVYDNGARILIDRADSNLDLTNVPDLSVEGDKDFVIYYTVGNKKLECTLKITTEPPVLEGITLNLGTTSQKIVIGDRFSVAGITATAIYSNNTTKPIANKSLAFEYDDTKVGTMTVTATYTEDDITKSATASVEILGISSISINAGSVNQKLVIGTAIDVSGLSVIITCENGDRVTRTVSDGVTVNTDNVDNTKVGDDSFITASYGGVTSANLTITVAYDTAANYFITEVALPESLTLFATAKQQFKNKTYGYVIGDDNAFKLTLKLSAYTYDGVKIDNLTSYTSSSLVYLYGSDTALSGDELALYVSIDESKNAFDFTEAAIGKTFTIHTRPRDGVSDSDPSFTRQFTVTVVDGYNIYEAWELNYMTNYDDFNFGNADVYGEAETRTQTQIVDDYLRTEHGGAVRPANLAGIVIHNNLYIKPADLPKEYFLDANRLQDLYDRISVFAHATTPEAPNFTIHGNYFSIYSSTIPGVVADGVANNDDAVSNGQLFAFMVNDPNMTPAEYDHTKYSTTVKNVYLIDENPNSPHEQESERHMRGLIGMKTYEQIINIDNCIVERYYISLLADSDYQTVNINESIYYNSWQNHLFLWSDNSLEEDSNAAPIANYPALSFTATNSSFTKCGGPVIISQTNNPSYPKNASGGPITTLAGDDSEIWTYVTGTEAWFSAMGVTGTALQILGMNPLFQLVGGSFITTNPGVDGLSGAQFMNIIMINLTAGMDMEAVLNGTDDLDGKFTIGDTTALDMTDTYTNPSVFGNTVGYGNPVVSQMIAQYGGQAPVFASSAGGVGMFDGSTLIDFAAMGMPTGDLGAGDFLTIYMKNMGIVLGYNLD